MGRDSLPIPRDVYGYSLYYYTSDYTPIGGTNPFSTAPAGLSTFNSLYNGNIAAMSTNITKLTYPWHYYNYRYDQLNRLKGTSVYKAGSTATPVTDYQEGFTYDGNGNILTATRNAGAATAMDNLTYRYNKNTSGRLTNNELNYIIDAVTTQNWPYGLNNQTTSNYTYDAIGNMTADIADTLSSINWTVYNKIQSLTNSKGTITYTYDPSGQRVSKSLNGITTWYIRDAQGNTLALYDNKHGTTNWKEQDLYGSSRLGMWQPNVTLSSNNAQAVWDTTGNKAYELSNHLGNVLATISDKRVQHSSNGTTIDYFDADVATAQEYYAFGGLMPGRTYVQGSNYRYGFNGKENDNDVKGTGNQIDYGNRIYDPRRAGFDSVDPLNQDYPDLSSYQFGSDNPILNIDIDGLEAQNSNANNLKRATGVTLLNKTTESATKELAKQAMERVAKKELVEESVKEGFENGSKLVPEIAGYLGAIVAIITPVPNDPNSAEATWMRQKPSQAAMSNYLEYLTSDPSTLSDQYLIQVRERLATGKAYASDYRYAKEANNRFGGQSVKDVEKGHGVVYLRIDKTGKLKPYIGQAESASRYRQRQREHERANPDADFTFQIIATGIPGDDLTRKEQQAIDAYGGVTNKKNPNGGTSNQRNPGKSLPKQDNDGGN